MTVRVSKKNKLAALRHCVLTDLETRLPYANKSQTEAFAANLGLTLDNEIDFASLSADFTKSLLCLSVSPDLSEKGRPLGAILRELITRYGDHLLDVAGFYRDDAGRIQLSLPRRSHLLFYRNDAGAIAGVLCQPILDRTYFLLSSRRYGGPKATPLCDSDRYRLEKNTHHGRA